MPANNVIPMHRGKASRYYARYSARVDEFGGQLLSTDEFFLLRGVLYYTAFFGKPVSLAWLLEALSLPVPEGVRMAYRLADLDCVNIKFRIENRERVRTVSIKEDGILGDEYTLNDMGNGHSPFIL